jgi:hypothetical protein
VKRPRERRDTERLRRSENKRRGREDGKTGEQEKE